MFLKALSIFRFEPEKLSLSEQTLDQALTNVRFQPCGANQLETSGFTSPLPGQDGEDGARLAYQVGPAIAFAYKVDKKKIPKKVVRERVAERAAKIEATEGRKLKSAERKQLEEDVIIGLTPQLFPEASITYGFFDVQKGYLIVGTGSSKAAEDIASHIRKGMGSLPVTQPKVASPIADMMSSWVAGDNAPEAFLIGEKCNLNSFDELRQTAKYKNLDLHSEEVRSHIESGLKVELLSMQWDEKITFDLTHEFKLKSLKPLDILIEQIHEERGDAEDAMAAFDVEFAMGSREVVELCEAIGNAAGEVA